MLLLRTEKTQFKHKRMQETQSVRTRKTLETSILTNAEDLSKYFPEIIGKSPALLNVLKLVLKISNSNSSVLILGESGTGKELIASAIHRLSKRSSKSFVAINCSAIPEELLEAELFGHEKGAFTGADRKRMGHFGVADGGTIFLDEIGDMTPRLQSKILRVLQEKEYMPVGSNCVKNINVRIIAATNKDLELAVKANKFRLDLYYRLNVLPITLPNLQERKMDIELLIHHFCTQLKTIYPENPSPLFAKDAIEALKSYNWPGNIRQLQNLVERLLITHPTGSIEKEDLPPEFLNTPVLENDHKEIKRQGAITKLPLEGFILDQYIENLENEMIRQALEITHNNKSQASKLLGMNRTTLVEKIKKRKIP